MFIEFIDRVTSHNEKLSVFSRECLVDIILSILKMLVHCFFFFLLFLDLIGDHVYCIHHTEKKFFFYF